MSDETLERLKIDKTSGPVRRRRNRWLAPAIMLAVVAVIAAIILHRSAIPVETVAIARVYPSQSFTLLNASGYVVAQRKAAVASKTTSRLEWLGVEEGSRVKAGQVLARLEDKDVVASRNQAAANLETARFSLEEAQAELHDATLSYDRLKGLLTDGVVSKSDYDAAEARFRKARAAVSSAEWGIKASRSALREAEVAVGYTLIRAPFDAVVLTKDADVGDIVTPLGAAANAKAAVVTIADLGSLLIEADVSESNLGKVHAGQPCEIQLDALPDRRFRGEVHTIVPTADRTKASVMVKVRFVDNDSRVLPEMSAKVAFLEHPVGEAERAPRTAVNPAAVVTRDGKTVVFAVKGDRVTETPITTGERLGDLVEIKSGGEPGTKVVLNPPAKLKDGSRIKEAVPQ
jgi:RND family efflux transporter MFP subunit